MEYLFLDISLAWLHVGKGPVEYLKSVLLYSPRCVAMSNCANWLIDYSYLYSVYIVSPMILHSSSISKKINKLCNLCLEIAIFLSFCFRFRHGPQLASKPQKYLSGNWGKPSVFFSCSTVNRVDFDQNLVFFLFPLKTNQQLLLKLKNRDIERFFF